MRYILYILVAVLLVLVLSFTGIISDRNTTPFSNNDSFTVTVNSSYVTDQYYGVSSSTGALNVSNVTITNDGEEAVDVNMETQIKIVTDDVNSVLLTTSNTDSLLTTIPSSVVTIPAGGSVTYDFIIPVQENFQEIKYTYYAPDGAEIRNKETIITQEDLVNEKDVDNYKYVQSSVDGVTVKMNDALRLTDDQVRTYFPSLESPEMGKEYVFVETMVINEAGRVIEEYNYWQFIFDDMERGLIYTDYDTAKHSQINTLGPSRFDVTTPLADGQLRKGYIVYEVDEGLDTLYIEYKLDNTEFGEADATLKFEIGIIDYEE